MRVALFIILHAVIYTVSADWFGSFGGSRLTALRVVAPTLAQSALFQNISCVYLYATLVSALPLYVAAIEGSDRLGKRQHRLPGRAGPVLAALALFGLFAQTCLITNPQFDKLLGVEQRDSTILLRPRFALRFAERHIGPFHRTRLAPRQQERGKHTDDQADSEQYG